MKIDKKHAYDTIFNIVGFLTGETTDRNLLADGLLKLCSKLSYIPMCQRIMEAARWEFVALNCLNRLKYMQYPKES